MEALLQDLRYALRTLGRSPGFTALAIITLGLGIGAATSGFSLLNWILLRPVPGVREPSRAGFVMIASEHDGGYNGASLTPTQRDVVLREVPAVAAMAGRQGTAVNVAPDGKPEEVPVEFVTADYFKAVGTGVQYGRMFGVEDDHPTNSRVAVIGDELWRKKFAARPDVLGQIIQINGLGFTVIGVAAPGFRGPDRFRPADVWLPGSAWWDVRRYSAEARRPEFPYGTYVLRLKDGATFDQASRQLRRAVQQLARSDTAEFDPRVSAWIAPGLGLEALYGSKAIIDHQLALILGVSGLVLLVTCANLGNLLLLRHARRRADSVVRLALGAGRVRLLRSALTEAVLIGLAGACVGVFAALWATDLVRQFRLLRFLSMNGLQLDWRVAAFAVTIGLLAAVLAGLLPAIFGSHADLGKDLKSSGPTLAGGAPRLRSSLAMLQVAISLTLVAGTYLFARTLQHYAAVPLGFDPHDVTVFRVNPKSQGYSPAQVQAYFRSIRERIAALPGVQQVGLTGLPPFRGIINTERVRRSDAPADATPIGAASTQVSGDYFEALRIPVLRGRTFGSLDESPDSGRSLGAAILSDSLARRLFGRSDPLGQIVSFYAGLGRWRPVEIVGVVGDIHWINPGGMIDPMLYTPTGQGVTPYSPMLVVRSRDARTAVEREVQTIAGGLDPSLPIISDGALSDAVEAATSTQRLLFKLVGLLSGLTLLLAAVGVYSLVAYSVTTRTREFGLRVALGADARDILRAAARPAVTIVGTGIIVGAAGAMYLTRFIKALLYGVSPLDPVAFVTAAALLCGAVLLASWIPARKASQVDPMTALRYE